MKFLQLGVFHRERLRDATMHVLMPYYMQHINVFTLWKNVLRLVILRWNVLSATDLKNNNFWTTERCPENKHSELCLF